MHMQNQALFQWHKITKAELQTKQTPKAQLIRFYPKNGLILSLWKDFARLKHNITNDSFSIFCLHVIGLSSLSIYQFQNNY